MIKKAFLRQKNIGELLIDSGLINKSQLEIALKEQQSTHRRVGETLRALVSYPQMICLIP